MLRLRWVAPLLCIAVLPLGSCSLGQSSARTPANQSECPWFTAGSAAHALKGEVRVTVSLKDKSQGVCTFSTLDPPRSKLKIFVDGNDRPSCPKGSPAVAGIGSQAYLCYVNPQQPESQLIVSGTVREKAFSVVMTHEAGLSGSTSSAPAGEYIKQIAQMVAGSLF